MQTKSLQNGSGRPICKTLRIRHPTVSAVDRQLKVSGFEYAHTFRERQWATSTAAATQSTRLDAFRPDADYRRLNDDFDSTTKIKPIGIVVGGDVGPLSGPVDD